MSCTLKRRDFLKTASLTAVPLWLAGGRPAWCKPPAAEIAWNVLLFMSDQHNPHFMTCDRQNPQNVHTPNMARLARQGVVFDACYATVPVCGPTRASLVSAAYPQDHGQYGNASFLTETGPDGATPSVMHNFRAGGYNTALMGKTHSNMQRWDADPTQRYKGRNLFMGFDYRLEACTGSYNRDGGVPLVPSKAYFKKRAGEFRKRHPESLKGQPPPAWEKAVFEQGNAKEGKLKRFRSSAVKHAADHKDGLMVFEAIDYLADWSRNKGRQFKTDSSKPFFVFVSVVQPHWPYSAPRMQDGTDFYSMYSGRDEDDEATFTFEGEHRKKFVPSALTAAMQTDPLENWPFPYGANKRDTPPAAIRLARARYSSAVSWVDHLLGLMLTQLDNLPDPNNPGKTLAQTTIVCYTSDHGDMMGEHHRMNKMVMYEGSARIPFIVRMPGTIKPAQRSDVLLTHNDMLPTLAGLCGIGDKLRKNIDGKDLSAAFAANDPSKGHRRIFVENGLGKTGKGHPAVVMTRTGTYKFIRFKPDRDGQARHALFDLAADPHETTNLAGQKKYASIVTEENEAINTFLAKWNVAKVSL